MSTFYTRFMRTFGAVSIVAGVAIATVQGLAQDELVLIALGISAGWLRFSLVPAGYLTLAPIAFFLALLITGPWAAFTVATGVSFVCLLIFGRVPLTQALKGLGEEAIPSLLAASIFYFASTSGIGILAGGETTSAYIAGIASYVLGKIVVGSIGANADEGISPRAYLLGASKNNVLNLLLLGILALGLKLYLFVQFGYFTLILVTIALVEFYHPWKLLSEQDEVLFSNLTLVAQAIDIKDPYTARHSKNVAKVAVRIARILGLPEEEVRKIRIGALMHDIGKIGVNTSIIRKPSKLDPQEQEIMRAHPMMSADIMQPIELLAEAAEIVRHHHEHIDGSGYPSAWKADRIPIGSRVILVADAFDAMTTDRPYRQGRSKQEALEVLRKHSGTQFDADVVRALEAIASFI